MTFNSCDFGTGYVAGCKSLARRPVWSAAKPFKRPNRQLVGSPKGLTTNSRLLRKDLLMDQVAVNGPCNGCRAQVGNNKRENGLPETVRGGVYFFACTFT